MGDLRLGRGRWISLTNLQLTRSFGYRLSFPRPRRQLFVTRTANLFDAEIRPEILN